MSALKARRSKVRKWRRERITAKWRARQARRALGRILRAGVMAIAQGWYTKMPSFSWADTRERWIGAATVVESSRGTSLASEAPETPHT